MSLKQFRVRDVLVNLPLDVEPGGPQAMCAEDPSVPSCIDLESLITPNACCEIGNASPFNNCWFGGNTPINNCWLGGFTYNCDARISPYVQGGACNQAVSRVGCGGVSDIGPLTPVIGGVNTPVVFQRIANTTDLISLKQELRHIMEVLEKYEQPSSAAELDAVEERLTQALEEVRARRSATQ